MGTMQNPAHNIYIHVPYCMSKCNYCAFFSRACSAPDWDEYENKICDEIKFWADKLGRIDVPTIFFGGGTPSLMPVNVFEKIINTIRDNFNLLTGAEITLESNPGTLDERKLNDFKYAGMNRLSIGVQSLDDEKLRFLGRRHTAQDALDLISCAQRMGLRVSADFIYGLPGDTEKSVIEMCRQINQIDLNHLSMYELTIEENTPFGKMNLDMPTNTEMAQMYVAIDKHIALPRYEVSNHCTPGNECQHNMNVWGGAPYIGIGVGAAGRIYMNNQWYDQLGNGARFEKISDDVRTTEKIITGLRTVRGCQLTDDIKSVIDIEWVSNHPTLVNMHNNCISATKQGMLVLDDVILNLIR